MVPALTSRDAPVSAPVKVPRAPLTSPVAVTSPELTMFPEESTLHTVPSDMVVLPAAPLAVKSATVRPPSPSTAKYPSDIDPSSDTPS